MMCERPRHQTGENTFQNEIKAKSLNLIWRSHQICIPSNLSVGEVFLCISTSSFAIQEASIGVYVPLSHDPALVDASFEVMDWTTHKPIEIEIQAKALPFLSVVDRTDSGIS